MPAKKHITQAQLEWMIQYYHAMEAERRQLAALRVETGTPQRCTHSLRAMAQEIGVCRDTALRILVSHGIVEPLSSKHAAYAPPIRKQTWTRPCMICRSTAPRPKLQYICNKCKTIATRGDYVDT